MSLVVDGWIYLKSAYEVFREGKQIKVPIMSGYNYGEGLMYVHRFGLPQSILFQRGKRVAQFDSSYSDITDLYVAGDPSEIRATEFDYISGEMFVLPSRELALAAAKAGQDALLCVFWS